MASGDRMLPGSETAGGYVGDEQVIVVEGLGNLERLRFKLAPLEQAFQRGKLGQRHLESPSHARVELGGRGAVTAVLVAGRIWCSPGNGQRR